MGRLRTFERSFIHPLPNYVAATSGGTQDITDDAALSSHPLRVQSIFGELDAAGKSWKAYQEGMTSNCMTSNTGRYAVKHNPGAYYVRCGHRAKSTTCPSAPRPVAISSTTSTTAPCQIAHSSRPTCATRRTPAQQTRVMPISRPGLARSWPGPTTNAATP